MKWMKKNWKVLFPALLFFMGVGLLLYPTLSNYWNSHRQAEVIAGYVENVAFSHEEEYQRLWDEAAAYNETLGEKGIHWILSDEEMERYNAYLKTDDTGIMAYIEIPGIDCSLPVYHGTGDAVLQVGAGHIEGSSLPVGGESSHCVLTGHCGLPSAKLFTDLDQMAEGDTFMVHTLERTLTYKVDRISIVEPTDMSLLQIEEGEDYCTLVTCTPYGINSHRLLVRGRRVQDD